MICGFADALQMLDIHPQLSNLEKTGPTKEHKMKLRFLSHSCFLITTDANIRILIDPFLSRNPLAPIKSADITPNYILLTHAHGDHLGDTIEIAKHSDITVVCVSELANYLSKKGIKTHAMQIGGSFDFTWGSLRLTPAQHGSMTPDGVYGGLAAGLVITIDGTTIYHCGDTGLFGDMKLIGQRDKIDYMLVPIGGNYTMDITDALSAVEFVDPRIVIPMHYDTFDVIKADPVIFAQGIEAQGRTAMILAPGDEIVL